MEEYDDQELTSIAESVNTESNELTESTSDLTCLLDEITARCDKQTQEISKWLAYTEDFKKSIDDMLERENTTATLIVRMPRTPRTPTPTTATPRTN